MSYDHFCMVFMFFYFELTSLFAWCADSMLIIVAFRMFTTDKSSLQLVCKELVQSTFPLRKQLNPFDYSIKTYPRNEFIYFIDFNRSFICLRYFVRYYEQLNWVLVNFDRSDTFSFGVSSNVSQQKSPTVEIIGIFFRNDCSEKL